MDTGKIYDQFSVMITKIINYKNPYLSGVACVTLGYFGVRTSGRLVMLIVQKGPMIKIFVETLILGVHYYNLVTVIDKEQLGDVLNTSSVSIGIEVHKAYDQYQNKKLQKQKADIEQRAMKFNRETISFLSRSYKDRLPKNAAMIALLNEKKIKWTHEVEIELFAETEIDRKMLEESIDTDFAVNSLRIENAKKYFLTIKEPENSVIVAVHTLPTVQEKE